MITASLVKELREKTGAGMMDCKKVLTETDGDLEKAIDLFESSFLLQHELIDALVRMVLKMEDKMLRLLNRPIDIYIRKAEKSRKMIGRSNSIWSSFQFERFGESALSIAVPPNVIIANC